MVVGSKGPAVPTGPESPAGPIDDRCSEEGQSRERLPGRLQQVLPDEIPGARDLFHVPVPVLEHAAIRSLDVIEDGAHAPSNDRAFPGIDDGEVDALAALDHDPVFAKVQLVEFPMLAVYERIPDELLDRGQHAAEDILVLVLRQASGEVVDEQSIAIDEEHFLDVHARPPEDQQDRHQGRGDRRDPEEVGNGSVTIRVVAASDRTYPMTAPPLFV